MATVRQDVATLGAGWNKTLLNYALAMEALDAVDISKRNSWKFLAAMHGFDQQGWINRGVLPAGTPTPPDIDGDYGNQCQHGSWYFISWHRGYLAAFEALVAAKVKELTGDDWALPYWNYLDGTNPTARNMPAAFLADTLPDGRANPLKRYPRRPGFQALPPPFNAFDLSSVVENDFTVSGRVGFGGGISGDFVQFGNFTGLLESNPHNTVHGLIGGFMGNALTAGLDPIFWLHHCNIDRIWEAWMRTPGKTMVNDPRWLGGPADRKFITPAVDGGPGGVFTSRDTLPGGRLCPTYDNLTKGTGLTPTVGAAAVARVGMGPPEQQKVDVVGANGAAVKVGTAPANTDVALDAPAAAAGVAAMGARTAGTEVSRLYLALEAVRGSAASPVVRVYVNLPEGEAPEAHPELSAGSITMFGLNVASKADGQHGGAGLGYTLDITNLAQRLSAAGDFDPDRLRVTVVPVEDVSDDEPITVERISVLKRTGVVS